MTIKSIHDLSESFSDKIQYFKNIVFKKNERKSEQDDIPHTTTMLDNAAHNEWQCHA